MRDGEGQTYRPFRRIYATVKTQTFGEFADRCRAEGVDIDKALTALVEIYAAGGMCALPRHSAKHAKSTGANYVADLCS